MTDRLLRRARAEDHEAIAAFTADTWGDRALDDYLADAFPEWIAAQGEDRNTLVATVDGSVVGVCQAALLTADEAWIQGLRVHPDHRGEGHARALTADLLGWCRDREATVARGMVFAWNPAGMGHLRAMGFAPVAGCRWARPDPDAGAEPDLSVRTDPTAAYRFWTHSDARTHLSGLALDGAETWALAELDRDRLAALAEDGRVLALVGDRGIRAMTARIGTRERDDTRVTDYAVGAWRDTDAARALFDAVRADAARCGADATRVLVPDTPRQLADVAVARASHGDQAVVAFAADLTRR